MDSPSRPSASWLFGIVSSAVVLAASCTPIEARPLSDAPVNSCAEFPCERYEKGSRTGARCQRGRCEISGTGGRPDYAFWVVVHVPDTSIFAPGMTYVLYSDEQGEPAFRAPIDSTLRCRPPQCLALGELAGVNGEYAVTQDASIAVGYPFPLEEGTSIPVRVVYEPVGNAQKEEFASTLPLDVLFVSSQLVKRASSAVPQYARAMPVGKYVRVMYPQPPFDNYFPPTTDTQTIDSANFIDKFTLGASPPNGKLLDDLVGDSRDATVSREDGLDGWRVWLEDRLSHRRISVVRTLSGKVANVKLYTTGENNRGQGGQPGLGDEVEAIVAPPESWTAVPRLVTQLFGGAGLKNLSYPPIPPPVAVTGVVAVAGEGSSLLGIPAKLTFESDTLNARTNPEPLLRYSTTLSTDDKGRFATILPPGTYNATIEPALATGRAKTKQPVTIDRDVTALTLEPPARTVVRGRVVLTDERPLSSAEVVAVPEDPTAAQAPRAGRAKTQADGRFELELDPGPYVLTVFPQEGTGFPRVVTRPEVPAKDTELPDIRVPAPTRLAFQLRDPSATGNPIVRAVVRILAAFPGHEDTPVEIGGSMTDTDGNVEILLAQEPR